jgi:small conductance mechanosensitive channel
MLLILRPFRVGHFVEVAKQQGTVREIGLFTTILTTRNQVYVSIPNSSVFSAIISNYTYDATRRVYFTFTIDVVNDLDAVEGLALKALAANSLTLKAPPPVAGVLALQEYAVQMYAGAYVRSADYWKALPALQRDVKTALDKAGILWAVTRQASIVRNESPSPFNAAPDEPAEAPSKPVPQDSLHLRQ